MPKQTTLVDIGDLLFFAEKQGYHWNQFIDMLTKDRLLPWCDSPIRELYVGYGDEYGMSKEVSDVIDSFCKQFKNEEVTINLNW